MDEVKNALRFVRRYPLVTVGGAIMLGLAFTGTGVAMAASVLVFLLVFVPFGYAAKLLLKRLDRDR